MSEKKVDFLFGPLLDGSDTEKLAKSFKEFMQIGYETRTPESVLLELAKAFNTNAQREVNYRSDYNNISNCSISGQDTAAEITPTKTDNDL